MRLRLRQSRRLRLRQNCPELCCIINILFSKYAETVLENRPGLTYALNYAWTDGDEIMSVSEQVKKYMNGQREDWGIHSAPQVFLRR
jgi:hypothetical protein